MLCLNVKMRRCETALVKPHLDGVENYLEDKSLSMSMRKFLDLFH